MYEDRDERIVVGQRVDDIHWHRGSAQRFLDQHRQECDIVAARGFSAIRQFAPELLKRIADFRNLKCAWDYLLRRGGAAPGPDRRTYLDYSHREKVDLLRRLSRSLLADQYVPGPERKRDISKGPGRDFRRLRLANVPDRVVHRGIMQILSPLLEPRFSNRSYGFRSGKNPLQALADAERLSTTENRWFWVCEDVRDAFDNVPLQRLFQIVHNRFRDDRLGRLIESVVFGSEPERDHGIRQGSPLSPLLLNVFLDRNLDQNWQREHECLPMLRYADDLLVLCRSRSEADCAYRDLRRILVDAGLGLKGSLETSIEHVDGAMAATWLGMEIHRAGGNLRFSIADSKWERLADKLSQAHKKPNSPLVANAKIEAFIGQVGPVYQSSPAVQATFCRRIREAAEDAGFDEIPSPGELVELWEQAGARWQELRQG